MDVKSIRVNDSANLKGASMFSFSVHSALIVQLNRHENEHDSMLEILIPVAIRHTLRGPWAPNNKLHPEFLFIRESNWELYFNIDAG